jgi:hypothetical protein
MYRSARAGRSSSDTCAKAAFIRSFFDAVPSIGTSRNPSFSKTSGSDVCVL